MTVAAWARWSPLIVYPGASLLSCALGARLAIWLAACPWSRLQQAAWPERARLAHPVRVACGATSLLPLVCAGLAYALRPAPPLPDVAVRVLVATAWLSGIFAVAGPSARAESRIVGLRRPEGRGRRIAAHALAIRPFGWLVMPAMLVMPTRLGWGAVFVVAVTAFTLHRVTRGDNLRLARRLGLVQDASPRLAAVVERAAARISKPPQRVLEMPSLRANAYAYPGVSTVLVSSRALEVLGDDELEAVCAHELGHLSESPAVVAARDASVVWLLPFALAPALIGSLGWGTCILFYVVMLVYSRFGPNVSARLERRADGVARAHEPVGGAYGRALLRLADVNVEAIGLDQKRRTHPSLDERLREAGVTPPLASPQRPSRARGRLAALAALILTVCVWLGLCAAVPGVGP